MQDVDFYQGHLDRVSRSFAFCIRELEPPLRQWISLSYLLCRALDTVEDAPWADRGLQEAQYARFDAFMAEPPSREAAEAWSAAFPSGIPEGEKRLLRDAHPLFEDLNALEEQPRKVIRSGVSMMRRGMQHYSAESRGGALRLADLGEVNRYCYFVAGVVGQLATELFQLSRPDFAPGKRFHWNALHFGLFLQKVNLLKDQSADQREGRYFVPNRKDLLASLKPNARGALDYLLELPLDAKGYRTFCAWSLFLGAASIPWMERSHERDDGSKIPRDVTQELLAAVRSIVQDNERLRGCFEEYSQLIPEASASWEPVPGRENPIWFAALTRARLDTEAMTELGMI